MEGEMYRFSIGRIKCCAINDGYYDYDAGDFLHTAPPESLRKALQRHDEPSGKIHSAYGVMFIETGDMKILIDTGSGGLLPGTGQLQKALAQLDVAPGEIDAVIITHAHPDHISGLYENPFANARIYSNRKEWDFWLDDKGAEKFGNNDVVGLIREVFGKIEKQMTYVEPGFSPAAGITLIDASGHTPGHMAVLIESEEDCLLYVSDAFFHPLSLEHPDWLPRDRYMINKDDYLESRKRLLNLAVEKKALVHAMHFSPAPSMGTVEKEGDHWLWHRISKRGSK